MIDRLRDALEAADYTTDPVLERIGDVGQLGLGRNSTIPAATSLGDASDPLATMIRLWILQQPCSVEAVERVLPAAELVERGYLRQRGQFCEALIDVRPYASPDDGASGWVVSDLQPGLDGKDVTPRPDYVLGVSPASTSLTQITARTPISSALDLGTGCGVQSLHLAKHAESVVATDVNERALELARLTFALSGADVDVRAGSLYEPVHERFDLIVSNPPFVMSPPSDARLTYRESNYVGDGLVEHLVTRSVDHLSEGGQLQLLTNWAITDQDWQERLASWVPAGCDAWFLERERLDVFAYIEMWLTDAGLAGTSRWRGAYDEWLAYFDRLGITGVGMGWVQIANNGRDVPSVVAEELYHSVVQPVGGDFARRRDAITLASLAPEALSEQFLVQVPNVSQQTYGRPGEADPETIAIMQTSAMCQGMKVSTAEAAAIGACDGELSFGAIVSAVNHVLEIDASAELFDAARRAIRLGILEAKSPK